MISIGLIILISALAISPKTINPILLTRLTTIILLYAFILSFNGLYIEAIGKGIGIYSGLFQVTTLSQTFDSFLFLIASLILIP